MVKNIFSKWHLRLCVYYILVSLQTPPPLALLYFTVVRLSLKQINPTIWHTLFSLQLVVIYNLSEFKSTFPMSFSDKKTSCWYLCDMVSIGLMMSPLHILLLTQILVKIMPRNFDGFCLERVANSAKGVIFWDFMVEIETRMQARKIVFLFQVLLTSGILSF